MSILGKRLKLLREKNNYSQKRVAESLGISNVQLSRYESGDRNPDPELIAKFADFYEVTTDYLHGRTDIYTISDKNGRILYIGKSNNVDERIAAHQKQISQSDDTYDSLAEINKLVKKYGIEDMGFFDIEKWKNLSPEEIKMLDVQFKAVADLAKKRNEEK